MSQMLPEPAHPLEVRMARLEGSYEQIDKRLSALESRLDSGFSEIRADIRGLRTDTDSKFDAVERKIDGLRNLIFLLFGALAGLITIFEFIN